MVTHSSILAWRIPCAEEPGRLQSMELQSQVQLKRLSTHTCRILLSESIRVSVCVCRRALPSGVLAT